MIRVVKAVQEMVVTREFVMYSQGIFDGIDDRTDAKAMADAFGRFMYRENFIGTMVDSGLLTPKESRLGYNDKDGTLRFRVAFWVERSEE